MPITKNAKKALRSSARKAVFNLRNKRVLHDVIKEVRSLALAGKAEEAQKLVPAAYRALDKAAKRGVIKHNAAARKKSRLIALIRKSAK